MTVREPLPPRRETMTVATLFPIVPEPEPETMFSRINTEKSFEDEAEAKVVKGRRGRRPSPKVNEDAETK